MKSLIKSSLGFVAGNRLLYAVFAKTILPVARHIEAKHWALNQQTQNLADAEEVKKFSLELLDDEAVVTRGVFKGMKWHKAKDFWGFPKLLGIYEIEIQEHLKALSSSTDYDCVVNVGSADGYYSVGLAKLFPNAKVMAYDIDPECIKKTRQVGQWNGVQNLEVGAKCDCGELVRQIRECKKALVVSDCEGFEAQLFNEKVIASLANHDVIIELHDGLVEAVSDNLERAFQETHNVEIIEVWSDFTRARKVPVEAVRKLNWSSRFKIVRENRSTSTGWLIGKSKVA